MGAWKDERGRGVASEKAVVVGRHASGAHLRVGFRFARRVRTVLKDQ